MDSRVDSSSVDTDSSPFLPATPPTPATPPSSTPVSPPPPKPYLSNSRPLPSPLASSPTSSRFRLTPNFIDTFRTRPPPFGYNGLGELVYLRTYSRKKADSSNEAWFETVERVVTGTYNMQKAWIESHRLGWNARKAQTSAQEMYRRIFDMKFLPPGRGLWAMGSPITEERRLYAALNNCAFVSTEEMKEEPAKPFTFLMDASMLGVGVGFDTKGAGTVMVKGPNTKLKEETFVIPDSREGWVEALRTLLDAFFHGRALPVFDFGHIRPYGTPIQGFGGLASGPGALEELLISVRTCLERRVGQPLSVSDIVDVMNYIGRCVVAGNVRRCLPGDALVHTRDGLVPIREVVEGTEVLTSAGFRRVREHVEQGVQGLVRIVTEDGVFRCTPSHRMAVLTDVSGAYVWKRAQELIAGDRLMSPRTPLHGTKTQLPAPSQTLSDAKSKEGIVTPPLDTALAWFIGAFMSKGYTHADHSEGGVDAYASINFAVNDAELVRKVKAQLQRFGEHLPVDAQPHLTDVEFITVRCQSRALVCYLHEHVKRAHTPLEAPAWLRTATLAIRQAFLSGVVDAEGIASEKADVVTTAFPHFARDVQRLLYSCGVESRLTVDPTISRVELVTQYSVLAVRKFPELCLSPPAHPPRAHVNSFPLAWCSGLPESVLRPYVASPPHRAGKFDIDTFQAVKETAFCPVAVLRVDADVEEATFDLSVEDEHEFYVDGLLSHNTAEIAFGDPDSAEYLDLKNYAVNPQRAAYGWTSNNSVYAKVGMDYAAACERVRVNGEPGFAWLENMQKYGRMNGVEDGRDHRARGGNPCLEQTLESYEMCCLVETFPHRHADLDDFKRTLKFAYLYAKTVTLGKTHWADTNRVMLRNRRIGCSVSGIAQFISHRSHQQLQVWLSEGYDAIQRYDQMYSDWLAIPRSIKTTSVKPSGTVSLLAGATPGMHYPESRFYIRRVRLAANSALVDALRKAKYHVEPVADGDPNTCVVEIPIDVGEGVRTARQVSMWEQLSLAAFLQRHWADNQVSCTVTFDPATEGDHIVHALNYFQYQLKGISFLPRIAAGAYKQMPYEEISEEEYKSRVSLLHTLELSSGGVATSYADRTIDRFCDGDTCENPAIAAPQQTASDGAAV